MMPALARTDTSVLGRWWWTVDRLSLGALALLIGFGAILILAASPPVATRIRLDEFHFVRRHVMMLAPSLVILLGVSMMTPAAVRRLSSLMLVAGLAAVAATLVVGVEIKGATRWLHLPGLSVQPSEFVKPAFAVVAAWLFAQGPQSGGRAGHATAILLFLLVLALLLAQPDLGMAVVVTAVFGVQFFLAGLPMVLVAGLAIAAVGGMIGSYFLFPHVASRIDRFLDPASGDNFQVSRSLDAFANGGLWGTGPGEGTVKLLLPDAHADFIFAVAGEEFGLLWCLVLLALFGFIVLRGLMRVGADNSLFVMLAGAGLLAQFGFQALINMGSTLHLIPTKGMTLPFVSYGGSSMMALAYGMGMALALTRRRPGTGGLP
jgi:cell division protein FtsW